jgi:formylglycine-generating enzyme required for sulfatase activity
MNEVSAKRFEFLRQLAAKYWKPTISWVTALTAAISVVLNGLKALGIGKLPGTDTLWYWLAGLGAVIFVIIRFPRVTVGITRLLLGSSRPPSNLPTIFRGPRPYGSEDTLPGRQKEIDACWRLMREKTFFILEGESGCGKSSLLNAALIPKARQEFKVIECRIAEDPFGKLCSALRQERYRKPEQPINEANLNAAIATAFSAKVADKISEERTLDPEYLTRLRGNLTNYFDEEELKSLCFDLGVDYDALPGNGKEAKARDLIVYLDHRGLISQLVEKGSQLRPKVSWENNTSETAQKATTEAKPGQLLLLCIDQFEEFFITVQDALRGRFLSVLQEAIEEGKLRLVLTIRNDFRDLLYDICRELDSKQETLDLGNYHRLQAFRKQQAGSVLDEILEPVHRGDLLMKQQLEDFSKALVEELLRPPRDSRLFQGDEKTVLPVELQTVGMMIESVGVENFSVAGLARLGGKTGLLRSYIEDAKDYVWRKTGIPGDQALLVLRHLISPAQTKWAQTAESVGKALGMPLDRVEKVLEAFAEKYLVNRLPAEGDGNDPSRRTSSHRYELMHDHLVQILIEAPDPILQKARDAEERLKFWISRTSTIFVSNSDGKSRTWKGRIGSLLAQPIPLMETLRLWRSARSVEEIWMLKRNLRGFGFRMVLLTLLLMPGLIKGGIEWQHWAYNMGKLTIDNPPGAYLKLTRIRPYENEKAHPFNEVFLKGSSIYLEGPADYVLEAEKKEGGGRTWTVKYPVYIHGYKYTLEVKIEPPPPPEKVPEGMAYIPAGTFRMGDKDVKDGMGLPNEVPPHNAKVGAFFLDRYEVNNDQYGKCVTAGKCSKPHYEDGTCWLYTETGWKQGQVDPAFREDKNPVVCVSWEEAQAYCEFLKKKLPTEAQWEKAAAGPEGYRWSFGNGFDGSKVNYCDQNCDFAWRDVNENDKFRFTAPVGTYSANSYGLFDMSGNVYEWVEDFYDGKFYGKPEASQPDPVNRIEGKYRVVRGGSWGDVGSVVRASDRAGAPLGIGAASSGSDAPGLCSSVPFALLPCARFLAGTENF